MKTFLSKWFGRRGIDRNKALRIVAKEVAVRIEELSCHDGLPDNCNPYIRATIKEPFWCIYAPWKDGLDGTMLRSSRILLVSKRTGEILFDGSAGDEG